MRKRAATGFGDFFAVTAERIVPGSAEWFAYHGNHISRYMFARDLLKVEGTVRILDAACGVGYGAHFLAENGCGEVIAVDRDPSALEIAREKFRHASVTFLEDDCQTLSKASQLAPFDAIVSFETIEHLPEPGDFLSRCREHLRAGQPLIVSTPNGAVRGSGPKWEFHEREYTLPEFESMLHAAGFQDLTLFGQSRTEVGLLRDEIRRELNILRSNPFFRVGRWVQEVLRGYPALRFPLGDKPEEYTIGPVASTPNASERNSTSEPFVLVAVAR